jgi:hypothetical protein
MLVRTAAAAARASVRMASSESTKLFAAQYARFQEVAGASVSAGWILPPFGGPSSPPREGACRVLVKRGHSDPSLLRSRASLQSYSYDVSTGAWTPAGSPVQLEGTVVAVTPSPSGRFTAVLRKEDGGGSGGGVKAKVVVELWSEAGGLLRTVVADKVHGDPLAEGWFGGDLAWSPDERYVAYVAEATAPHVDGKGHLESLKAAAATSATAASSSSPSSAEAVGGAASTPTAPSPSSSSSSSSSPPGTQFDYEAGGREDYGEKYVGVRQPRIFVVDFGAGAVLPVPGIPDSLAVGQPVWAPALSLSPQAKGPGTPPSPSYFLVYTGWTTGARRLGMIYCYQRPCALYAVDLTPTLRASAVRARGAGTGTGAAASNPPTPTPLHFCLTSAEPVARSARFSPDGRRLAYLGMQGVSLSTHNGPSTLRVLDWARWRADAEAAVAAQGKDEAQAQARAQMTETEATTNASAAAAAPVPSSSPRPQLTTLASIRSPVVAAVAAAASSSSSFPAEATDAVDRYLDLGPPAQATPAPASTAVASPTSAAPAPVGGEAASGGGAGSLSSRTGSQRPLNPSSDETVGPAAAAAAEPGATPSEAKSYSRIVVDEVWSPWADGGKAAGGSGLTPPSFPGLHAHSLPASPWTQDSRHLFLTSLSFSRTCILRVDVDTGKVTEEVDACDLLQPLGGGGGAGGGGKGGVAAGAAGVGGDASLVSTSVLAVRSFGSSVLLLASVSSPSVPAQLGLLNCDDGPVAPAPGTVVAEAAGAATASERQPPWSPSWWMSSCPPALPSADEWPADDAFADDTRVTTTTGPATALLPPWDRSGLGPSISAVRGALASLRWAVFSSRPDPTTVHPLSRVLADGTLGPAGSGGTTDLPFESILLFPAHQAGSGGAGSAPLPLLVVPHGGPHSALTTSFLSPYAYIATALPTAVLFVNYRGSLGAGAAATASLPGRCGSNDVEDMVQATLVALAACGAGDHPLVQSRLAEANVSSAARLAVQLNGLVGAGGDAAPPSPPLRLDPARVSVSGGSHGGFLTAHLIGQHPSLFRAAIMRNPVVNVASMVSASDISDWCWTEGLGVGGKGWPLPRRVEGAAGPAVVLVAGGGDGGASASVVSASSPFVDADYPAPTPAAVSAMFAASPIAHVERVRDAVAVLLMLGQKDRRVPPSQGVELYHVLRGMRKGGGGGGLRMLSYPEDTHALDRPATEADAWVNIAGWLREHG